jgi:hypothetical protein
MELFRRDAKHGHKRQNRIGYGFDGWRRSASGAPHAIPALLIMTLSRSQSWRAMSARRPPPQARKDPPVEKCRALASGLNLIDYLFASVAVPSVD